MTRDNRGGLVEVFLEENFWDGIFDALTIQAPMAVLTLFIGGVTVLSLYSWTESVTIPAIVLALFGGIIILMLPGPAAIIATLAVVVVVAAGLAAIYGRG